MLPQAPLMMHNALTRVDEECYQMATNKIQTGLRLNETIYEKVKVISTREQRSMNNFIEFVIQRYIEEYECKNGEIEILLED